MVKSVKCPHCKSEKTVKNGSHKSVLKGSKSQKLFCKDCGKSFRRRYKKKGYKAGVDKKLSKLLDENLSIRKIAEILSIAPGTVFKKKHELQNLYLKRLQTPYPIPKNVTNVILWSGGKDSSALLIWALENLPRDKIKVIFCDTGWEAPITYQFIQEVNQRLLDNKLIILKSEKYDSLIDLATKKKRFPSPKARFCTEELKIVPTIQWILDQKEDLAIYQGIRAEESNARSKMCQSDDYFKIHQDYANNPYFDTIEADGKRKRKRTPLFYRKVMEWLQNYDCSVERPLFYWKEKDIIEFCQYHKVLNPLYKMGFKRVGCFPCIMENKSGIRTLATKFPKRIEEIEKYENEINSTFFPNSKIPIRIAKLPKIKSVVEWATVDNKKIQADDLQEKPTACMSHFNSCE